MSIRCIGNDCGMCTNSDTCPEAFGQGNPIQHRECYFKDDVLWAFDTFISQLKSSESINSQSIRLMEHLRNQFVTVIPTHIGAFDVDDEWGEE